MSNFGNFSNESNNSCKVNHGDQEKDPATVIATASMASADQSLQPNELDVRRDALARKLHGEVLP